VSTEVFDHGRAITVLMRQLDGAPSDAFDLPTEGGSVVRLFLRGGGPVPDPAFALEGFDGATWQPVNGVALAWGAGLELVDVGAPVPIQGRHNAWRVEGGFASYRFVHGETYPATAMFVRLS
jgi:hypothetical protein